jgi:hypothetical protein
MTTATHTKPHSFITDSYLQALSRLDTCSKIEVIEYLLHTLNPLPTKTICGNINKKAALEESADIMYKEYATDRELTAFTQLIAR